jgi:hypothetical protein
MTTHRRSILAALALIAGLSTADAAVAQAQSSGRYELEFEGAVMGGVTGVGATVAANGASTLIELPAVVASYPTVRFEMRGPLPERPMQGDVGSGGMFQARFSHPDLTETYIGDRGFVRITDVSNGRIRGEFAVVASPVGAPGTGTLTYRGRFEAPAG